jgi:hypothetical protein
MTSVEHRLPRIAADLTDEQLLIARAVRSFATARLAPRAAERDRDGTYPLDELDGLAELGLLAMKVPAELGGGGADNVGYVLAMQAVAEACVSTAVVLASSNLVAKILADHASPAQRARWLRPYGAGQLGPASFALSEPACGSDAAALTTTARPDGDAWLLSGAKMWITSGAHAGFHLVFARTDGPGPAGISAFGIPRPRNPPSGVDVTPSFAARPTDAAGRSFPSPRRSGARSGRIRRAAAVRDSLVWIEGFSSAGACGQVIAGVGALLQRVGAGAGRSCSESATRWLFVPRRRVRLARASGDPHPDRCRECSR